MSSKAPSTEPEAAASDLQPAAAPANAARRQRLLDAAVEILLGEGMPKFTSARIAEAAGLHKPAFYAHFKNADECLQAVAIHVARAKVSDALVHHASAVERLSPGMDVPSIQRAMREHTEAVIERLLTAVRQHETLYRLLRRYRYDESALGEAIREIDDLVFERWNEHFLRVAVYFGVDPRHFKEIAHMAEHVVAISYIAIGRVLDGRATDVRAEAERTARYGFTIVEAELRRMLQPRDAGDAGDH